MARSIAVAMRKGGSGKTTTTVNLAAALALRNQHVLLIDLDPQANATVVVGIDPTQVEKHVGKLLADPSISPQTALYKTYYGLYVLPSHVDLAKTESGMTGVPIVIYEPEHSGAVAYKKLAEVIDGQA